MVYKVLDLTQTYGPLGNAELITVIIGEIHKIYSPIDVNKIHVDTYACIQDTTFESKFVSELNTALHARGVYWLAHDTSWWEMDGSSYCHFLLVLDRIGLAQLAGL